MGKDKDSSIYTSSPSIEIDVEDDGFRVTSIQSLGVFDSFKSIADHIDNELYDNVAEVAKLNTIMGLVALIQTGLITKSVQDAEKGDYLGMIPVLIIAGLMMYIRNASLEPNKEKRAASWHKAQNFENYVTSLQTPVEIFPGE
jgi:hypothetical protein